jgi:hypothetical protein
MKTIKRTTSTFSQKDLEVLATRHMTGDAEMMKDQPLIIKWDKLNQNISLEISTEVVVATKPVKSKVEFPIFK